MIGGGIGGNPEQIGPDIVDHRRVRQLSQTQEGLLHPVDGSGLTVRREAPHIHKTN